eukprot:517032-Hanusia_phi.AAC.3
MEIVLASSDPPDLLCLRHRHILCEDPSRSSATHLFAIPCASSPCSARASRLVLLSSPASSAASFARGMRPTTSSHCAPQR